MIRNVDCVICIQLQMIYVFFDPIWNKSVHQSSTQLPIFVINVSLKKYCYVILKCFYCSKHRLMDQNCTSDAKSSMLIMIFTFDCCHILGKKQL